MSDAADYYTFSTDEMFPYDLGNALCRALVDTPPGQDICGSFQISKHTAARLSLALFTYEVTDHDEINHMDSGGNRVADGSGIAKAGQASAEDQPPRSGAASVGPPQNGFALGTRPSLAQRPGYGPAAAEGSRMDVGRRPAKGLAPGVIALPFIVAAVILILAGFIILASQAPLGFG